MRDKKEKVSTGEEYSEKVRENDWFGVKVVGGEAEGWDKRKSETSTKYNYQENKIAI